MKTYKIVKRYLGWRDVEYEVKAKDENQARRLIKKTQWADFDTDKVKEIELHEDCGYEEIRTIEEEK